MEELAAQFADLIEGLAKKIRSMTVDRIDRGIRLTGLGILAGTFALTAVLFLILAIFGALEIPLTTAGAFGVFAAVLIGAGVYMWIKRSE
ncbi:MAG: hypothetical protein DWQ40_04515 [Actinobacteria bacterium]|nr:MAG: hypothetical protein DWQ40_04515 [Actinomycetota bacterium]REK41020.1 MAG: hypothetical protein DWQ20_00605 [Actinomycetota bacterium]